MELLMNYFIYLVIKYHHCYSIIANDNVYRSGLLFLFIYFSFLKKTQMTL